MGGRAEHAFIDIADIDSLLFQRGSVSVGGRTSRHSPTSGSSMRKPTLASINRGGDADKT